MQREMDRFRLSLPRRMEGVEAELLEDSQIIANDDGTRRFKINFNVNNFKPEEIVVKFDRTDKSLSVTAHHESLQDGVHAMRHFSKMFRLPSSVESESMTSSIKDGVLTVEGPLSEETGNSSRIQDIPIEKLG